MSEAGVSGTALESPRRRIDALRRDVEPPARGLHAGGRERMQRHSALVRDGSEPSPDGSVRVESDGDACRPVGG